MIHAHIRLLRVTFALHLTTAMLLNAWKDLVRLILQLNVALVAQSLVVGTAAGHVHLALGALRPVLRRPLLRVGQWMNSGARIMLVTDLTSCGALASSLLLRLDQFTLLVEELGASLIVQIWTAQCLL